MWGEIQTWSHYRISTPKGIDSSVKTGKVSRLFGNYPLYDERNRILKLTFDHTTYFPEKFSVYFKMSL
jgi:hypothetical protein